MPKKKPAKLDSTTGEAPADVEPKWTQKDQDELDELGFPDDISPEALARYHAMLPPAVRAEIEKEADAQAKEMMQKFEEHVRSLPKGAALLDSRGRRVGFIPLDDLREIQSRDGLQTTKKFLEKCEAESEADKVLIVDELTNDPSLNHIALAISAAEGKVTLDPWQEEAADVCKHASRDTTANPPKAKRGKKSK